MRVTSMSFAVAAGIVTGCVYESPDESTVTSALSGAIFTTLVDGTRVNHNIYQAKTDVYLDGGPGDGAPQHAAGLPDGDYYFMVTDPSGKTLLSSDAIECRRITIDDAIITAVRTSACSHQTGVDQDHGALTVQLMPYRDTPNPGGEYKVWITPVNRYDADEGKHGFIPRYSKTDNFKVRQIVVLPPEEPPPPPECEHDCPEEPPPPPPPCDHECTPPDPLPPPDEEPPPPPAPTCGDGHVDDGEECDDGNTVDGDLCSATCVQEPCFL